MNIDEPTQPSDYNLAAVIQHREKPTPSVEEDGILQKLQALVTASITITSALDLDSVLQRIADTARQFASSSYAAVGVVDECGVITSFITSGISQEVREKIGEAPRGHGMLGVLIKQGKPLRVRDISKDPRHGGFPPHHPIMTSLLGMPSSMQGRIVGDLYLTDKIGADEFSAQDEWWVALFAQQAAVAVENATLYKKARVSQQRAQTLAELTSALNRSIEPEELFKHITQASCHLLELPASALYILDTAHNLFVLQSQVGLQLRTPEQCHLPLEGSVAGSVLSQNGAIVVADTSYLPQLFCLPMANGAAPRSLLVVPIRQDGRISGVIEVYSEQLRAFSPEEVSLLEAFAAQAAMSLDKAQLYKQKEEFLSMTAHDLRAPLTAIKLSTGLLTANLTEELPAPLFRLIANIDRNSERLGNLVEDLLDLMRLEQGRMQLSLSSLEIGELVATSINTLMPLFEGKQQDLNFEKPEEDCWLQLDRNRFEQALTNLLANANKYAPMGGTVEVKLEYSLDYTTIKIIDNGPGIPLEEQNRIFDRYYRQAMHEHATETSGSGLGLPIARYLIELHGGKLWVESEVGQGSTFCIRLLRSLPD
jgi:signal transduction histidine kinase